MVFQTFRVWLKGSESCREFPGFPRLVKLRVFKFYGEAKCLDSGGSKPTPFSVWDSGFPKPEHRMPQALNPKPYTLHAGTPQVTNPRPQTVP